VLVPVELTTECTGGVVGRPLEVRPTVGDGVLAGPGCRHVGVIAQLQVRDQEREQRERHEYAGQEDELATVTAAEFDRSPAHAYHTLMVTGPPSVATVAVPVVTPGGSGSPTVPCGVSTLSLLYF
jgi:hypothetical protein